MLEMQGSGSYRYAPGTHIWCSCLTDFRHNCLVASNSRLCTMHPKYVTPAGSTVPPNLENIHPLATTSSTASQDLSIERSGTPPPPRLPLSPQRHDTQNIYRPRLTEYQLTGPYFLAGRNMLPMPFFSHRPRSSSFQTPSSIPPSRFYATIFPRNR